MFLNPNNLLWIVIWFALNFFEFAKVFLDIFDVSTCTVKVINGCLNVFGSTFAMKRQKFDMLPVLNALFVNIIILSFIKWNYRTIKNYFLTRENWLPKLLSSFFHCVIYILKITTSVQWRKRSWVQLVDWAFKFVHLNLFKKNLIFRTPLLWLNFKV